MAKIASIRQGRHDARAQQQKELHDAGVTYRQMDYWVRTGRLRADDETLPGPGHTRLLAPGEVEVASLAGKFVASISSARITPIDAAFSVARQIIANGSATLGPFTVTLTPGEPDEH